MKLTAESTDEIVHISAGRARLWKATTDDGTPCFLVVRTIAVSEDAPNLAAFDRDLSLNTDSPPERSLERAEIERRMRVIELEGIGQLDVMDARMFR